MIGEKNTPVLEIPFAQQREAERQAEMLFVSLPEEAFWGGI